MESPAALRGAGSSKWLMTLFAVIVALGLGVMAGYLIKPIGGPTATQTKIVSTEAGPTGVSKDEHGDPFAGCAPDFTPC